MRIILTRGIPASGKTTWAEQYVRKNQNFRNINRDDLRFMLFGRPYKFTKTREKSVTEAQFGLAELFLENGNDVIISDTNLNPKTVNKWKEFAKELRIKVEFQDFMDVSVDECIKRDLNRLDSVGEKVIRRMYDSYMKNTKNQYEGDTSLPNAVIFDIDGTLALMNGRSPFDWDRVKEDSLNIPVFEMYRLYKDAGYKIIILSGRDGVCKELTEEWLEENGITYDEFYIRDEGNTEKDSIIKERIFDNYIGNRYNVCMVVDDRPQVCRMWRQKGLFLSQIADPYDEF